MKGSLNLGINCVRMITLFLGLLLVLGPRLVLAGGIHPMTVEQQGQGGGAGDGLEADAVPQPEENPGQEGPWPEASPQEEFPGPEGWEKPVEEGQDPDGQIQESLPPVQQEPEELNPPQPVPPMPVGDPMEAPLVERAWVVQAMEEEAVLINKIHQDSVGQIFVVGYRNEEQPLVLLKYDSDGNEIGEVPLATDLLWDGYPGLRSNILFDQDNYIYVSGKPGLLNTKATYKFDESGNVIWRSGNGGDVLAFNEEDPEFLYALFAQSQSIAITKLNTADGQRVNIQNYFPFSDGIRSDGEIDIHSVIFDRNGNLIVGGHFRSHLGVVVFDPELNRLWARFMPAFQVWARHLFLNTLVIADDSGGIYFVGKADSTDINPEMLVAIKYDEAGNVLWENRIEGEEALRSQVKAAQLDSLNNLIIASDYLMGEGDHGDDCPNDINWMDIDMMDGPNNTNWMDTDMMDDCPGNVNWMDTDRMEEGNNNVNWMDNDTIDPGDGRWSPPSYQISLMKLGSHGEEIWNRKYAYGPDHRIRDLKVDTNGHIYVNFKVKSASSTLNIPKFDLMSAVYDHQGHELWTDVLETLDHDDTREVMTRWDEASGLLLKDEHELYALGFTKILYSPWEIHDGINWVDLDMIERESEFGDGNTYIVKYLQNLPVPECGDEICDFGENYDNCAQDCPYTPVCGNDVCDQPDEDCFSCIEDCSCDGPIRPSLRRWSSNEDGSRCLERETTYQPPFCDAATQSCVNDEIAGERIVCWMNCPLGWPCEIQVGGAPYCCTRSFIPNRCVQPERVCVGACGNGICEPNEDCSNCQADCGACTPVCGNGICDRGENQESCRADCCEPSTWGCQFIECGLVPDTCGGLVECPNTCNENEICEDRRCQPTFLRGDANGNGEVDMSDGQYTLNWLFMGGPEPYCKDAADANDDGTINISDSQYIFNFLFLSGPEPKPPFDEFGVDPTDDELDCIF